MAEDKPRATLEEMRSLMAHLPGPDLEAGTAAASREAQLTKPAGALGRLEELVAVAGDLAGQHPPSVDHPAHRRLRRQSRRRRARRLGLSRRGHRADGGRISSAAAPR